VGGGALRWGLAGCALAMLVLFVRPALLSRNARSAASACSQTSGPVLAQQASAADVSAASMP
ncbi:MAG TPA: hypothetical protein P5572_15795, partial [Phycisphaerae bacterium]|nr:hypothetical protein [Phycisphaerae bacterium]